MLALEERFMIREMYRKGVSISEIARRIGRDRKTIRQVVNAPDSLSLLKPQLVEPQELFEPLEEGPRVLMDPKTTIRK